MLSFNNLFPRCRLCVHCLDSITPPVKGDFVVGESEEYDDGGEGYTGVESGGKEVCGRDWHM